MNRMNRRRFVAVTSAAATSAVLVACGTEELTKDELNPTQVADVSGAPPTIAPKTATPGASQGQTGGDSKPADGGTDTAPAEMVVIEGFDNFSYTPNELDVYPGQKLIFRTAGFAGHDLHVDEWGIATAVLMNGEEEEFTIPEDVEVGTQVEFYCAVVGHRQNGMWGTFTVVEAGSAPAGDGEGAATEEASGQDTAAPADSGEQVVIEGFDDFRFEPNELEVYPGQKITYRTAGFAGHDLHVDEWGIATAVLLNGQEEEIIIPEDVEVGTQVEFYCAVVGHRQNGMWGTMTVVEAGSAPAAEGDGAATEEATAAEEATQTEEAAAPAGDTADSGEQVVIEGFDDFRFDPKELDVYPGQKITYRTAGFAGHDLHVDEWGIATAVLLNGQEEEIVIPEDVEVGTQVEFYCAVVGHRQNGMWGTFTVVEAGSAPAGDGEDAATEEATETEEAAAPAGDTADSGEQVVIEGFDDFRFEPNELDVHPGQKLTYRTAGFAGHDLHVDEWGIATAVLLNGQEEEIVIPDDVEVGSQVEFYCAVVGHRQNGMWGTFTVVEAGSAPAGDGEGAAAEEATATEEATAAQEATPAATPSAENTPEHVTLVGTKWKFEPAEFEIAPGGTITFQNNSGMTMGLSSDEWDTNALQPMIKSVTDGKSADFTVPDDAEVGSVIEIRSTLSEAVKQGMVAKATVVEAGESSANGDSGNGEGSVIEIQMLDMYAYEPSEVEAAAGDTLRFINMGYMEHDAIFDDWGDAGKMPYQRNGESYDLIVPDTVKAGEEYEFYCSVIGHKQAGMVGTLTIVE